MDEKIVKKITDETRLKPIQVIATIRLLEDGNTVPFIARYRKEMTGSLDEVQIREIERLLNYYKMLEERRKTIIESIEKQGKMTDELMQKIISTDKLQELEDIYLPYKPKKRTRATIAREKGLEPLAQYIMDYPNPEDYVDNFVNPEKGVNSRDEAIEGAIDIVAEIVSEDAEIRKFIRETVLEQGVVITKSKNMKENSDYKMYENYKEPVSKIKPHRVLAINRGEREDELTVKIEFPDEYILKNIKDYFIIEENSYIERAIEDGYKRLIKPSIEREIRSILTEKAEEQAIKVFSRNLKKLLMQPPLRGYTVMGIDPGIRTGSKIAIVNKNGDFITNSVIYQENPTAINVILSLVKEYKVDIIAIGNGTGFRDVEKLVAYVIKENNLNVKYTIVPETGASVYSASDIAREEFPDLDLTVRGAISIARRLQDPISELVKIDPKSLGVGQYQHDVDQTKLSEELDKVVQDCVNKVGVNLNTASYSLLKYVSGITPSLAKKIVIHRQMKGGFKNREELKKIKGFGDKTFEQAAGFLKIDGGNEPLDNTWVHPENYELARELLKYKNGNKIVIDEKTKKDISQKFNVGNITIQEVITALEKPNLDPRDDVPKPILREDILTIDDLKPGMIVQGIVRNVVDFGAFVDIGIKNDALVHISEISDSYISHPLEVLGVSDIIEAMIIDIDRQRERVSLSIKKAVEYNRPSNNKEKAKV
ncbi:MAG TPA: Tex family protein [Spirochaetota bacterium]|nr:Tex family protein [Spirochaetota bacterium]HOM38691.1 Tex family protein [Spirochaetota bacterium]HPQ49793.1 Tex family protein [Spirochaetota bacterium]